MFYSSKLTLMCIHDVSRVSATLHRNDNVTVREQIQSVRRSRNDQYCRL